MVIQLPRYYQSQKKMLTVYQPWFTPLEPLRTLTNLEFLSTVLPVQPKLCLLKLRFCVSATWHHCATTWIYLLNSLLVELVSLNKQLVISQSPAHILRLVKTMTSLCGLVNDGLLQ